MTAPVLVLDLDGVIRHFDPDHMRSVAAAHGVDPGALVAAAFGPDLMDRVITGRITRAAWTERVGAIVGNADAAREWLSHRGRVDPAMLAVVAHVRAMGARCAILTNGTDAIGQELTTFGLDGRFDHVFNSAEIGVAKPDRRVYEHVCSALGVPASSVIFVDDTAANVTGARAVGIDAHVFAGVEPLRVLLRSRGLLPAAR